MANSDIKVQWVDIKSISPNKKNRNIHPPEQIDEFVKQFKYQGFRQPLVISNQSKQLVVGHGRLQAAKKMGLTKVPVSFQDFEDSDMEYAFATADNALSQWSSLDLAGINLDLADLGPDLDISLLGIKDFELEPADKYADKDADAIPDVKQNECGVKLGDIYQLGEHRLMCGDSTDLATVEKLMNGEKADMVFTDPPYGINAVSNSGVLKKKYKTDIKNDDSINVAKLSFELCQKLGIEKQIWWGANYYSSNLPNASCWLVWDKNNGGSDQMDCELAWSSLPGVTRQFTLSSEKINRVHPTQKPVALNLWVFDKWGTGAKNILDLFLGSGSTLIACEKTLRKCYGMELDPHYCSVIIKRWQDFTGKKAKKL